MERESSKFQEISPLNQHLNHHLVVLCAVRHAMQGSRYLGERIIEWLQEAWGDIASNTKMHIKNDLEYSITCGHFYETDKESLWEEFLEDIKYELLDF